MNFLSTILAFIFVLGTLIVIHELGHYLVARWCGVKVLRFSVGMGKVIWSRRFGRDQTEWAISLLPLGGYVKMLDAREADLRDLSGADLAREFTRQSVWKRIAIVSAGPIANFLLAILLYAGLYMTGMPEPAPRLRSVPESSLAAQAGLQGGELVTAVNGRAIHSWSELRWQLVELALGQNTARLDVERTSADGKILNTVNLRLDGLSAADLDKDFLTPLGLEMARPAAILGKIDPDGPAAHADLKEGDRILRINGRPVRDALALVEVLRAAPGRELEARVLRGEVEFTADITPEAYTPSEGQRPVGRIRVGMNLAPEMVDRPEAPHIAVWKGAQRTWDASILTLRMIGKLFTGEVSLRNITGPITIADYAGQTARAGVISFIQYMAIISISLGVMNLLPIPVLDGGLLMYYAFEVVRGRPVSERFGEIAQRAGIGILMTLMFVAVFNDITRLLT